MFAARLLVSLAGPAWAQDPPPAVFRSSVDLVSMAADRPRRARARSCRRSAARTSRCSTSGKPRPHPRPAHREWPRRPASPCSWTARGSMKVGAANDAVAAHLQRDPRRASTRHATTPRSTRSTPGCSSVQEFTHDLKAVTDRAERGGRLGLDVALRRDCRHRGHRRQAHGEPPRARRADRRRRHGQRLHARRRCRPSPAPWTCRCTCSSWTPAPASREKVPFEAERRSLLANLARATGGDFFVAYDTARPPPRPSTSSSRSCATSTSWPSRRRPSSGWRNVQVRTAQEGALRAHARLVPGRRSRVPSDGLHTRLGETACQASGGPEYRRGHAPRTPPIPTCLATAAPRPHAPARAGAAVGSHCTRALRWPGESARRARLK